MPLGWPTRWFTKWITEQPNRPEIATSSAPPPLNETSGDVTLSGLDDHKYVKRLGRLTQSALLTGPFTLQQLSDACLRLEQDNPGFLALATLDDFEQAHYTNMHSVMAHDLDRTEGHDLSGLPSECFENGEHIGFLTTPAEFPIRAANFRAHALPEFASLRGATIWDASTPDYDLDAINRDPARILDKISLLRLVPATIRADTIAAFPNGYFSDDLTPFDNFTLARRFENTGGYGLFAIGASFLAFRRDAPLTSSALESMTADILTLCDRDTDAAAKTAVQDWLTNSPFLILRYTQ